MQRILYGYWRSSASYRVRLALNLKGLDYEHRGIHLVKGEQHSEVFKTLNPQGLIPLYVESMSDSHSFSLAQSLAIMDYLDERYPEHPLLPADLQRKARIKSAAQIIACEIHPLDNLRVLQYLETPLNVEADAKMTWYRHWITTGFAALEQQLPTLLDGNPLSMGERAGYLEALIVPQVYNARRFNCPLDDFPQIVALTDTCNKLSAFIAASPENQPDAD